MLVNTIIHQHVLLYQGKGLRIILLYFCRRNKKVYGFFFLGGGHPVVILFTVYQTKLKVNK